MIGRLVGNLLGKFCKNTTIVSQNGVNIINGSIVGGGMDITTRGDKVYINGELVTETSDKQIQIHVEGNVDGPVTTTSGNIVVNGDATRVETTSGNIQVGGNISGGAKTMSGSVKANIIHGGAKTMSGSIKFGGY